MTDPRGKKQDGKRKDIADTIRKLLRKAESTGYEDEAKAFRKKAEEMMRKHALTRAELERATFVVRHFEHPTYSQAPGWYKSLVANVGTFLGVFTAYDSRETGENCVFILGGREQDIEMLEYTTEAIKNQVQQLTEEYKEDPSVGRKEANAYRLGVVQRVGERLRGMVRNVSGGQEEEGLVLVEENRKKQEQGRRAAERDGHRFRRGQGAKYQSEQARKEGVRDGDRVNVNKGAPTSSEERRLSS